MATAQNNEASSLEFKIYDTQKKEQINLDELVASVGDVQVLFFGEEHDDSLAHVLQDSIYGLLIDRYGTVTLSMEMFETDCQQVLNEYLGGFISEKTMIKDARAWKNYKQAYKPLIERAKEKKQIVIAANAPRRYVNMVSRKGLGELELLPKASKAYFPPLPIYTQDSSYYERFQEAMGGAGHGMDDNFFYAQCTWDASMSYCIFRHWKKHKKEKLFHLNGRFHTDFQQGTMAQLLRRNKKIKAKNITCTRVENLEDLNWDEWGGQGDYIIVSPKI